MPMRSRRERFPVEWGHAARSTRKEGRVERPTPGRNAPHSRMNFAPWGTLTVGRTEGTPWGTLDTERMDGHEEAVVLMAKAPVPGRVKTRLCPPLAPAEAARLYACMLGDAAEEISSVGRIARYLFLDRPVAANTLRGAPFSSFERFPQRGKDLGEKMRDAAATAFRRGARRVVIVGADCPSLSAGTVRRAFLELSTGASVVFGPSADGGYYLVGLACRTNACSGDSVEHAGGAAEHGGPLQDLSIAVLVPASRSGTWTPGRTFSR